MADKVTLIMSTAHARVVRDACEMLMRMKLGQYNAPWDGLVGIGSNGSKWDVNEYCVRQDIASDIMRAYLRACGYKDGTDKDDIEQMAYEVWGAIRHAEWASEEHEPGDWDVRSQEPLSESGKGVPQCRIE